MKPPILALPLAALTLLAAEAAAQTAVTLVRRGDEVLGVGTITNLNAFSINDEGEWLAHVTTDALPAGIADVILRDGFLTLQQGTILGKPAGSQIAGFSSINVDSAGNSVWDLEILLPGGTAPLTGLYFNTKLIALQGDPINTVGYSRSATWLMFNGAVKGNNNNQFIVTCLANDMAIGGTADDAMVLMTVDNQGNILSSFDIAHEGGQVPMLGRTVLAGGLPLQETTQYALNNRGDVIWQTKMNPPTNSDRAVFLNNQVLVQEGAPSAIAGLFWQDNNARVGLNDRGDWVMLGRLSGPANQSGLLVLNNKPVVRERTTFPAIAPSLVDNFATKTPILVGNNREPIYRLGWTGQSSTNTGLLVGDEIVVRRGMTKLDNFLVDLFIDSQDAIAISPGGRFLLFRVDLEEGSSVVGRMDLGRVTPIQDCAGNTGELTREKGFPVIGKTITLGMGKGQGVGVTPFVLVSDRPVSTYPPCGVTTNFGELIIDFGNNGNPFLLKIGNAYVGSPVAITLPIANTASLIDQHVYVQGIFVNIGGQVPGADTLMLTNALDIEIGAP